jgi:hypothetical protein
MESAGSVPYPRDLLIMGKRQRCKVVMTQKCLRWKSKIVFVGERYQMEA